MNNDKNNKLASEVENHRKADYEVDSIFLNRWSPRSFLTKKVSDEILLSVFEAARWAPSGSNLQPWRFILARTQEEREQFYEFINEGNREWCEKAPVLTLVFSHKLTPKGTHNRSHTFDAGTAWGYLALQASQLGLITHAMGGFDPEKAREILQIPEDYELHAVIAIGYRGEANTLSEAQQQREKPSVRKSINEFMFNGKYGNKWDVK
jgi:nitroreductase